MEESEEKEILNNNDIKEKNLNSKDSSIKIKNKN